MENAKEIISIGMNNYLRRIEKTKSLYLEILTSMPSYSNKAVHEITDKKLFNRIIKTFITGLDSQKAEGDLQKIYKVCFHYKSKAIIIANYGATLYSLTEKKEQPHIVRHIGLCVYMPGLGMEYANVGLVGNVYDNQIVLRTESACTPSFLFGSQRCNCYYQWKNIRELAASFNQIKAPKIKDGQKFEKWVQEQFSFEKGRHNYQNKSNLGFVMLHLDSQNGMGSGYTKGEFVFDLAERASMRHRGEYTAEQTYNTTMYGGFTTIGINGDPRAENNHAGYKITPIILDFLSVSKEVIMLTNNPLKIKQMEEAGYKITRVKSIGAVNIAGSTEASQRGSEFNHLDITGQLISFKEDYKAVRSEIKKILKRRKQCKYLTAVSKFLQPAIWAVSSVFQSGDKQKDSFQF